MARMVLDRAVGLPAGILGETLRKTFPDYRWQVGDGPQEGVAPLDRATSIFGRSDEGVLLLGIELIESPLEGALDAPPHRFHVRLTGPSTDSRSMAERMLAIVGQALAAQGGGALQIDEGGPWLGPDELARRAGHHPEVPAAEAPALEPHPLPSSVPDPAPSLPPFPRGTGSDRPQFGRKRS